MSSGDSAQADERDHLEKAGCDRERCEPGEERQRARRRKGRGVLQDSDVTLISLLSLEKHTVGQEHIDDAPLPDFPFIPIRKFVCLFFTEM